MLPSALPIRVIKEDTDCFTEEICPSAVDTRVAIPLTETEREEISVSFFVTRTERSEAVWLTSDTVLCRSRMFCLASAVSLSTVSTVVSTKETRLVKPFRFRSSVASLVVRVEMLVRISSVPLASFHALPFQTMVVGGDTDVFTHS